MRRSLLLPNLRLTPQILNDHRAQFHLARFRFLSRRRTHGGARRLCRLGESRCAHTLYGGGDRCDIRSPIIHAARGCIQAGHIAADALIFPRRHRRHRRRRASWKQTSCCEPRQQYKRAFERSDPPRGRGARSRTLPQRSSRSEKPPAESASRSGRTYPRLLLDLPVASQRPGARSPDARKSPPPRVRL